MIKNNKFSIILPYYNHSVERATMLTRAINSVMTQTYQNFELILIDDGSKFNVKIPPGCKTIRLNRKERALCRNEGMKMATGDWICWLDSDDAYVPHYLEVLNQAINKYPEYKVFNWGGILIHNNWNISLKEIFKPKLLKVGHEVFPSGDIMCGTYAYHRDCIKEVGLFPNIWNCWMLAAEAMKEFPELKPHYPDGKELGNPWGDDYYYFYKLTRKFHSKPLNVYLYVVYGKYPKEIA